MRQTDCSDATFTLGLHGLTSSFLSRIQRHMKTDHDYPRRWSVAQVSYGAFLVSSFLCMVPLISQTLRQFTPRRIGNARKGWPGGMKHSNGAFYLASICCPADWRVNVSLSGRVQDHLAGSQSSVRPYFLSQPPGHSDLFTIYQPVCFEPRFVALFAISPLMSFYAYPAFGPILDSHVSSEGSSESVPALSLSLSDIISIPDEEPEQAQATPAPGPRVPRANAMSLGFILSEQVLSGPSMVYKPL